MAGPHFKRTFIYMQSVECDDDELIEVRRIAKQEGDQWFAMTKDGTWVPKPKEEAGTLSIISILKKLPTNHSSEFCHRIVAQGIMNMPLLPVMVIPHNSSIDLL